jgi:hypothetical protein
MAVASCRWHPRRLPVHAMAAAPWWRSTSFGLSGRCQTDQNRHASAIPVMRYGGLFGASVGVNSRNSQPGR